MLLDMNLILGLNGIWFKFYTKCDKERKTSMPEVKKYTEPIDNTKFCA